MERFSIALSQMPPDAEGRCRPAVVILEDFSTELLRVAYDDAAKALLREFGLWPVPEVKG